jgi:LysR family hydrogen peroxide-inducible transcriptional activator
MSVFDISLKDLGYVLAVAKHRSFSAAALECAVSQPALSKQIKNLEQQLKMRLFERDKRQVSLTEMGARFVQQASIVLDEAEKLVLLSTAHESPLSGRFQLGAIASACPYLLPLFVGDLKTKYPHLQLMVKEGLTDDLIRELKQGKLDAVIAATTFESDSLSAIPLFFEPFLLASRKDGSRHQGQPIDIQDIDTSRLLLLEDGHCLKAQTLALCSLKDQGAAINFKATSVETLLQMSAGGMAIAVIPALARPVGSRLSDNLVFSSFINPEHGRTMALYYRSTYPLPANVQAFATFITHHLPQSVQVIKELPTSLGI